MKKLLVLCVALILVAVSCTQKEEKDTVPDYPVRVEIVEGVKTVFNPDYPREGFFKYDFIEEVSIGSTDPNEESVIDRPYDIKIDTTGLIYIMDWGDTNIKVFSPQGQLVKILSRQGQGPGEMTRGGAFDISDKDDIFVLDGMGRRIFYLNKDGQQISEFKVAGYGNNIVCGPKDDLYYSITISPDIDVIGEWQTIQNQKHLFHVDRRGKILHDFGVIPDMKMRIKATSKRSSVATSSREALTTVWSVSPTGILFMGYNDKYRMDTYDGDGNHLFQFGRDFEPVKHPRHKPGNTIPEFYPAYFSRNNCFDDGGNLWLRQYVEGEVEHSVYDVFSPDGIYLKRVEVPRPLWQIREGRAYSILRDEEGYVLVKKYRMVEAPSDTGLE
ncbi:6-bladed beta-propeller [Acidobacteriota bacterium]